jgi:quinol monooxygenase YgiN
MSKQLTLFVTFTIHPQHIEEWKAAHRPVWASCAVEPKCLLFDVFADPERLGRFRLIEVWIHTKESFEKVCSFKNRKGQRGKGG